MKKIFKILFISILFTLIGSLNVFTSDIDINKSISESKNLTELSTILIIEYGSDDQIESFSGVKPKSFSIKDDELLIKYDNGIKASLTIKDDQVMNSIKKQNKYLFNKSNKKYLTVTILILVLICIAIAIGLSNVF